MRVLTSNRKLRGEDNSRRRCAVLAKRCTKKCAVRLHLFFGLFKSTTFATCSSAPILVRVLTSNRKLRGEDNSRRRCAVLAKRCTKKCAVRLHLFFGLFKSTTFATCSSASLSLLPRLPINAF